MRSYPTVGGILAFNTEQEARRWMTSGHTLIKGIGKKRRLPKWRAFTGGAFTSRLIVQAWADSGKLSLSDRAEWPDGTVALEWFEPTEVIAEEPNHASQAGSH
jgi:hypothetical protein